MGRCWYDADICITIYTLASMWVRYCVWVCMCVCKCVSRLFSQKLKGIRNAAAKLKPKQTKINPKTFIKLKIFCWNLYTFAICHFSLHIFPFFRLPIFHFSYCFCYCRCCCCYFFCHFLQLAVKKLQPNGWVQHLAFLSRASRFKGIYIFKWKVKLIINCNKKGAAYICAGHFFFLSFYTVSLVVRFAFVWAKPKYLPVHLAPNKNKKYCVRIAGKFSC